MYTAPLAGDCQKRLLCLCLVNMASLCLVWLYTGSGILGGTCVKDHTFSSSLTYFLSVIITGRLSRICSSKPVSFHFSNVCPLPPLPPFLLSLSPSQQVEPFLCDCVTISKRLAQAIEPFSKELREPKNLEETEKVLHKHQLKKRRTYDKLHIDQLTTEGLKINRLIKQESEERYYLTHVTTT